MPTGSWAHHIVFRQVACQTLERRKCLTRKREVVRSHAHVIEREILQRRPMYAREPLQECRGDCPVRRRHRSGIGRTAVAHGQALQSRTGHELREPRPRIVARARKEVERRVGALAVCDLGSDGGPYARLREVGSVDLRREGAGRGLPQVVRVAIADGGDE